MTTPLEEATYRVLAALAKARRPLTGHELTMAAGLSTEDLNDAVSLLAQSENVEVVHTLGTQPYNFREVKMTARGRYEFERVERSGRPARQPVENMRPPTPIGSPYGFQDQVGNFWRVARLRREFSIWFSATNSRRRTTIPGYSRATSTTCLKEPLRSTTHSLARHQRR